LTSKQLNFNESQDYYIAKRSSIAPIFFFGIGLISLIYFHADIYFSIWISVLIALTVVLYFLYQLKTKKVGFMMTIILAVFLLPFIHIPPYLWFDFESSPLVLWGLAVNPYMVDETVIKLTAMIGATGAAGMAFGISLVRSKIIHNTAINPDGTSHIFRSMGLEIWLFWLLFGVALSWISSPQETVFNAIYTESESLHANLNFSSAWMISYVILTFVFVDALIDPSHLRKTIKWKLVILSVAYVFIWLQLFRGDRESIPWVFSLAIIYYYWAGTFLNRKQKLKGLLSKGIILIFILLIVSLIVGMLRSGLSGLTISDAPKIIMDSFSEGQLGISNLLSGTWSASLLTPLSVAGDHIYNLLEMKYGQTYLDILLSLPPGFIADAIGYERPLTATNSLAWEMRYGIGGTHATVAPFVNFGMLGVFLIPAIWSYFLKRYELKALYRISVVNLSLLATVVMASPHWFWYGEKNGINALIIWFLFALLYRISLGLSKWFVHKNQANKNSLYSHV